MDFGIDGNAAIVAASSSGLGKASAHALAREGANVVINGRDVDRLEEAVTEIGEEAAGAVVGHPGDLTDAGDTESLVRRCLDEFGRIDHLVTNAGGPPSGPFLGTDDDDWYHAYELLVMSAVRLVREAAESLRADGGGTIVTITSRSVKEALDALVLSNAVRMSVIGLEKTLARELAPEVRANAVLPGVHETGRIRDLVEQAIDRGEHETYEEGLRARSESIPLDRIGDPMEFGNAVAFLSSPRSGFITGTALPIDGGSGRSNL